MTANEIELSTSILQTLLLASQRNDAKRICAGLRKPSKVTRDLWDELEAIRLKRTQVSEQPITPEVLEVRKNRSGDDSYEWYGRRLAGVDYEQPQLNGYVLVDKTRPIMRIVSGYKNINKVHSFIYSQIDQIRAIHTACNCILERMPHELGTDLQSNT